MRNPVKLVLLSAAMIMIIVGLAIHNHFMVGVAVSMIIFFDLVVYRKENEK